MTRTDDAFTVTEIADSPQAVVLLIGWVGAQPRYLNKYAELYQNCWTVTGTANTLSVMTFSRRELDRFALGALHHASQLIKKAEKIQTNKKKIPVVFHGFSNGGGFVLERLEKLLAENDKEQNDLSLIKGRLAGQVFDSAPAYLHVSAGLEALGSAISNPLVRLVVYAFFLGNFSFSTIINTVKRRPNRPDEYWSHMCNSTAVDKQAFIYSEADAITDCSKLEELIDTRKKMGVTVSVLKLEDSGHVQHLRKHPEAYRVLLQKFLAEL